jgi:lipoate---protein ligase
VTEAAPAPGRWDHDEELIVSARAGNRPRARAYAWPPPGEPPVTVVVGRGGRAEVEVDLAAAAADGVPVLRRRGGGCAVVLDPGNAVVSLALPLPGVGGTTSAFARISAWLIEALAAVGVDGVTQQGVSDLARGGRKIGGACLWRTQGLAYYSTTLLVAPDLDLVERYLPHPPREPDWRGGRPHRDFMGRLAGTSPFADATGLATRLEAALDTRYLSQP